MKNRYFVSGIGTDVGKTVVSAILTEALQADYWKPIQAGDLQLTDSNKIEKWISNSVTKIHPERYKLKTPASPHWAAEIDGVAIKLSDFEIPATQNNLIIEGAGGLMVPINSEDCIIDLLQHLKVPVILVSYNYLGSINHSLLSIEALKSRQIPIAGIIFNGPPNASSEKIILSKSGLKLLGNIPLMPENTSVQDFVKEYSGKIKF